MLSPVLVIAVASAAAEPDLRIVSDPDDPRQVVVEATLSSAERDALPDGQVASNVGQQRLRFAVVDDEGTPAAPMLGRYLRSGNRLTFIPRFRLTGGQRYRAGFTRASGQDVTVDYVVPAAAPTEPSFVTKITPTSRVVPANMLKFYIHFSKPMREGRTIFDQIQLFDQAGNLVSDPWRRTELWNDDATRFTLWIHPGRVKQGVNLREEFGPVLKPNTTYKLVIPASLRDASGQPLKEAFRWTIRAQQEDRTRPLPQNWELTIPGPGTRDPLVINFHESLDAALARRCIEIHGADNVPIAGRLTLKQRERIASFVPESNWAAARHVIVVDAILEDLAGNTPLRVFDNDLTKTLGEEPRLVLPFTPEAPDSNDRAPSDQQ